MQCLALWERVAAEDRWNKAWGIKAIAAAQRLTISLSHFADTLYELTQFHAEAFQVECLTDMILLEINAMSSALSLRRALSW